MSSTTEKMIQQVMKKVTSAIETYSGEEALELTAYEAEKSLMSTLLSIGALLMGVYFATRAKGLRKKWVINNEGRKVAYHSQKKCQHQTLFGELEIESPYYYERGEKGQWALAGAVQLPEGKYSQLVRELHCELAVNMTYGEISRFLGRHLQLSLSTRVIQQFVLAESEAVEAYYQQRGGLAPKDEKAILVAQGDGKGIPMAIPTDTAQAVRSKRGQARSRKKESIITSLYTIAPRPRTAEEVLSALFEEQPTEAQTPPSVCTPHQKMVWGSLAGKDHALKQLQAQATKRLRGCEAIIQHRVALTDGADALQRHFREKLPDFSLVLDFIHALEYLWKAANARYDEDDPQRLLWVKSLARLLLEGQTQSLIDTLHETAQLFTDPAQRSQHDRLLKVANYFQGNKPFLVYDTCLAHGWPIASGVIEGACRHVVKDRFERSGMRWTPDGAQALLHLRSVHQNGHWDEYFHYRRQLQFADLPQAA